MAASALEFESGGIDVYQVLASKRIQRTASIALTRRHLDEAGSRGRAEPLSRDFKPFSV